jgi:2-dehydro-3-deoxyphosphogluconate aldolase / (4S)-4-hydroxy-2-oxoglutarate aldolase
VNNGHLIIQIIKEQGLLPLFYHNDTAVCIETVKSLYEAGVRCIEFINRGNKALENFMQLVKERNNSMKELLLGIGTIKNGDEATAFINAGADFLVSPVFDSSVCDVAYLNKVLWIPGCMTPTEIHAAEKARCSLIKLFPGNVLGPGFVEAIKPLFTGLDFIVTGGVDTTKENIKAWFKSGVSGVGMGSKLITKDILQNGNYEELKEKTKEVIAIINNIIKAK